jgi:hypothetical protein
VVVFCNKQKKLRYDSNPAFTDIDFGMLNQHLYNDYHVYLSMADRRTLNTVGDIIDHIIYRLKDGNSSLIITKSIVFFGISFVI